MSHPADNDTSLRRWLFQFRDVIAAFILLMAIEGCLFHFGLYFPLLKAGSHAGKRHFVDLTARSSLEHIPKAPRILLLGNSTIDQGIDLQPLNQELKGTALGLKLAQGGMSPRSIYHILRHQDFDRLKIRTVVVGVPFTPFRLGGKLETSWSTDKNHHIDLAVLAIVYGASDQPRLARVVPRLGTKIT